MTVHFQVEGHLGLKDANICLESLEAILDWFVKQYHVGELKGNKWKISSDMLNKNGSVPPKAEGCMISRKKEVGELRACIISNKTVIIRGYTGIGKTELAKDYVAKYRKKYDGIYYAENIDKVDNFLYELPIGIIDEELKTKEEIVEEKLDVVHSMDLTYLFILDNYTGTNEELYRIFPDSDDRYHVMVLVGEGYDKANEKGYYEVKAFSPENSLKIFDICNHISHPCGYGVWDGNTNAMDFVKYGTIRITDGDIILAYTDGMKEIIDKMELKDLARKPLCELDDMKPGTGLDDRTCMRIDIEKMDQ